MISDARGNTKKRPVLVISDTSQHILDQPVIVLAITTTFPDPPSSNQVQLPWDARRHRATRLARRSAVVCNWVTSVPVSDLKPTGGFLPKKYLIHVLQVFNQLHGSRTNKPDHTDSP